MKANLTKLAGLMALGGSVFLPSINANAQTSPFYDDFSGDLSSWTAQDLGLENSGAAGYNAPSIVNGQLVLGGTTSNGATGVSGSRFWYGTSLLADQTFSSSQSWIVSATRVSLTPGPSGVPFTLNGANRARSSIIITQSPNSPGAPGSGQALASPFIMFAQDIGEGGWEYNDSTGGRGTEITAFDGAGSTTSTGPTSELGYDAGSHLMQIIYTPTGLDSASFSLYLDGTLGATINENNWDNSQPFYVLLSGMARAGAPSDGGPDTVQATFDNFSVTPEPGTVSLIGLGVAGLWLSRRAAKKS